jgi:hypothetical protein
MDTAEPPDYIVPSFIFTRKELSKSREEKTIKKASRKGPNNQGSHSEVA